MSNVLKKVTLLSAAVLGLSGVAFATQPTTVSANAKTTAVAKTHAKKAVKKTVKKSTKKTTKKASKKTAKKSTKATAAATAAAAAAAASNRAVAASNEAALANGGTTTTSAAATVSSSTPYVSVGNSQTTVDSTFNIEAYNSATGGKRVQKVYGSLPLFNGNVNWSNAVNTFNADTSVKGNNKDTIPAATLSAALKKDGFDTVYMKVSPTILPRLAGGIVDNIDSLTGIYFKFSLDQDALAQNVKYGDNLRLSYTADDSSYYVKALPSTKTTSNANADGYVQVPIYRQWIKDLIDQYIV
jgi:hypothetical protein